ncbi:MAG TPA: hypothetical protein VFY83_10160, partial [Anaerolineales bacterium]|nr:hypothetical protein [Anaerolineales bacterium]
LLEALQMAIETQTDHTALRALMEIAMIEMKEGKAERALELVLYCLQHSATKQEVIDPAESLRAELVAQLTPEQIEAVEGRAQAKTLEHLAQEILRGS